MCFFSDLSRQPLLVAVWLPPHLPASDKLQILLLYLPLNRSTTLASWILSAVVGHSLSIIGPFFKNINMDLISYDLSILMTSKSIINILLFFYYYLFYFTKKIYTYISLFLHYKITFLSFILNVSLMLHTLKSDCNKAIQN